MKKIKDIPSFQRPREKLTERGAEALSDTELLAILLGSGIQGKSVLKLARNILHLFEKENGSVELSDLLAIEGIGPAKACQLMAALEFSRRRFRKNLPVIRAAKDIIPFISRIRDKKQEHFLCLSLNGANEVIANRVITIGLLNSSQIHPREVFAEVISDRACSVILAHNHPSGSLEPSPEDLAVTSQMVEAGRILGIKVLDHVIISRKGSLSMKEKGII